MTTVFLSYSHKDEAWKDRLQTHLVALESQGLLDPWDDRRIKAGADWFEDIQDAMARASVAVLFVSKNFLTSKFIRGQEVPKLLERRSREGLHVIPVIVGSCLWKKEERLAALQARPTDGRPLARRRGDNIDAELAKIAEEILSLSGQKAEVQDRTRDREPRSDGFLDRVEAVYRLREPEAEVRRYPGIGAAGGYLRVVRQVGDFPSGREIGALTEHQSLVNSVAFSPDGKSLASGSYDGTIRLWNVADGRCLAVLYSLPEGWVAYSPDGRYKFGGVPAGGFWHAASLCRFEIGELDDWVPGLRLADDASFFDLPAWKPEVVVPARR